jgi:hypothetical protein
MRAFVMLDSTCDVAAEVAVPTESASRGIGRDVTTTLQRKHVAVEADFDDDHSPDAAEDGSHSARSAEAAAALLLAPTGVGTSNSGAGDVDDSDDGVKMRLYPLRAAGLFALLVRGELAHDHVDRDFVEYMNEEAPLHPTRGARPASIAAAPTGEEEVARAVSLIHRTQISSKAAADSASAYVSRSQPSPSPAADGSAAAAADVLPVAAALDLPKTRPGAILATTANLKAIDLSRFHLSEAALAAVVRLVPFCVNLTHLGMVQQRNATSSAVVEPLARVVAATHPSLTSLDFSKTFVEWEDMEHLANSAQRNMGLVKIEIDHKLCKTPPTLVRKLAARVDRNQAVMRSIAVRVRGAFTLEPFETLRSVTREQLATIHVPWQV